MERIERTLTETAILNQRLKIDLEFFFVPVRSIRSIRFSQVLAPARAAAL
jgi:hypothetical protein